MESQVFHQFSHIPLVSAPRFAYRGGKANLRRFIARWIPLDGNYYAEPFAGRGNVFFMMRCRTNYDHYVLNDIQTFNFFSNMKSYGGEKLPELTLAEIPQFREDNPELFSLMEPILTWAGGVADKSTFVEPTRDLEVYRNRLILGKQLLKDCHVSSVDALELLNSLYLDNRSFVYLDPPYLSGKVGIYRSNSFDRNGLIEMLKHAKFRWLLSEYECDDLNEAFGRPSVFHYNVPMVPVGSSKAIMKTEVLYSNYLDHTLPNHLNFGDQVKPCRRSISIFDRYETLTKSQFQQLVPSSWAKINTTIEFSCLTKLPYAYWDGQTLYNLHLIKSFNQQ